MLGLLNLRQAVNLANNTPGKDDIELDGAAGQSNDLTLGQILITEEVTIKKKPQMPGGPQSAASIRRSIDADPFRIFEISLQPGLPNAIVEFQDVVIANGMATGNDANGGGIKSTNANLRLTNAQVHSCYALGDGGGIWARGDDTLMQQLVLDGSMAKVVYNQADNNGGGVAGTNIYVKMANGSGVSGNTAKKSGGGIAAFAINWVNLNTLVEIKDGTIDYNTAVDGDGGGLYTINQGGPLAVVQLQTANISNNKAIGLRDSNGLLISGGRGGGFCTLGRIQVVTFATTTFDTNGQGSGIAMPQIGVYLDPLTVGGVAAATFVGNYVIP